MRRLRLHPSVCPTYTALPAGFLAVTCFLQHVTSAISSSGNQCPGRVAGGFSPSLMAVAAAITQLRMTCGGISVHPFRLPASCRTGAQGTCSFALPMRTVHQLRATAIAKARSAVYSASPVEGYFQDPSDARYGVHSDLECVWWQLHLSSSISGTFDSSACFLLRAPPQQQDLYKVRRHPGSLRTSLSCWNPHRWPL